MDATVQIKGMDMPVNFVRHRKIDPKHNGRETVTILAERGYETVKELFTEPGRWSITETVGNETVRMDCEAFETLCSITDRDGILEIVMGKATEKELLEALLGIRVT